MKLLVFGKTGQVARELQRLAPDATYLGREQVNVEDPWAVREAIESSGADAIINATAYTAVDTAEQSYPDSLAASGANALAPEVMALIAAEIDIPFLHISTDYVFDGSGSRPFAPDDPTAPQNVYGKTKRDGEIGVRNAMGHHLILRTSWVFSAHGKNFVKTMLRLGAERESLNVVADQIGGPTPAAAIADALLGAARAMLDGAPGGTHHFAGVPDTSWADFAREIMRQANLSCRINDIPTADYPTPAKRPLNSRLDCRAFTAAFGIPRPDWREGLKAIMKELRP